jgi:hypothetical protein
MRQINLTKKKTGKDETKAGDEREGQRRRNRTERVKR